MRQTKIQNFTGNIRSIVDAAFRQLTELGSLTIIFALLIFTYFHDSALAIILFIGIMTVTLISLLIKIFFHIPRPNNQKYRNFIERVDASSFPSAHSARVSIMAFWLVIYSNVLLLKIFIIVAAILVAYSRIYLKKHYFIDVLGGLALGIIVNLATYYIIFA